MQKYLLTLSLPFLFLLQGNCQSINPQLLSATYFGSPGNDFTGAVSTDHEGNIYLCSTVKSGAPTTLGVHQTIFGGGTYDAMISKFDKSGKLVLSTYFGGSGYDDNFNKLKILSDGAIVTTGATASPNKIATAGAHDTTLGGGYDAFVAVFEPDGKLRWSTYFGGSADDYPFGLDVDNDDNIYLTGSTLSNTGIATTGSFQPIRAGAGDGFFAKFDKTGSLQWASYLGGVGNDALYSIGIDKDNNIYLGGEMNSSKLATTDAFDSEYGGGGDGFLTKFNKEGQQIWATYFGTGGKDEVYFLDIDHHNNVYIMGPTTSPIGMASVGAYASTNAGKRDVFIAKFDPKCQRLWSTFLGGTEWDTAFGCDFDNSDNIYVAIMSQSYNFPITYDIPGPYYNGGAWDAAFVKFSKDGSLIWSTYFGGDGNDRALDICLDDEQNIIASINSDSPGLATPGAFNETARGFESLLIKMSDATIINTADLEKLPPLTVFPNPASDFVEIPNHNLEKRNIAIYNLNGEMVLRFINSDIQRINTSKLLEGEYIIHTSDSKGQQFGRFIKVK
ncbi:MAG: SBBP repeat-containing protein [Saprospiraceae bacterium]|nr:SBBP repeat-containing protein [Saprospiraceae bacterium]